MIFTTILCALPAAVPHAQRVPGRDLLEYPLGALAEAPALALETGDGLRNPAGAVLPQGIRARVSALSLITGSRQGVNGQVIGVSVALPSNFTGALSVARASVSGITRTDTDPQSIGGDVPYNTLVVSATAAQRQVANIVTGIAVRYRTGELDGTRKSTVGLDGGVVFERILDRDVRAGISSFLWRPGDGGREETAFAAAVDARVLGSDSLAAARVGYSFLHSQRVSREHFYFGSGRFGPWEGRAGFARGSSYGATSSRVRLAIGLHYARYTVGISREDNPAGLDPTYQFTLSAVLP